MLHLRLIIFLVGGDTPVDSEVLLITDFVNLKIKSTQSFRCDHRRMIYIYMFIWVGARTYINIYVCIMFLKKDHSQLVKVTLSDNLYLRKSIYTSLPYFVVCAASPASASHTLRVCSPSRMVNSLKTDVTFSLTCAQRRWQELAAVFFYSKTLP
jgi:hypothetical protein